jgi:DNA polymerase-3 subunit beta
MSTEGKYIAKGGFYIKAGELKIAIGRFEHVIPKKATDEVFERILIHQIKDRLELSGSDGEIYASFVTNVVPTWEVTIGVSVAVPYKLLTDFLKSLPEEAVLKCMQVYDEKGIPFMLVESDYGNQVFHGIDYHNYPPPPRLRPDNIILMNEDAFRDMVARTIFAAADATYPNLSGVYFDFLPDRTNFVATNRFILSVYTRTDLDFPMVEGKPKSIIVPTKALKAFMAGIQALPRIENVLIYPLDEYILLAHKGFFLSSKLINDRYPDYQKVIPAETPHVATFEHDKLYKSVKRLTASVKKKEMARIEFTFSSDSVALYAPSVQQKGGSTEKVVCNYAGDSLKVIFCSTSLLSILENIRSERVTMRISCNTRPVIIEPEPQSLLFNMLYLIMPMACKV